MIVPQNFFESTILSLLNETGMNLTDDQKKVYLPQFQAQLEKRISNDLTAQLSESQIKQFVSLIDKPETSPEEWSNFWHTAIPNFDEELQKTVTAFASEMKALLV